MSSRINSVAYFSFAARLWEFLCGYITKQFNEHYIYDLDNLSFLGLISIIMFSFSFKCSEVYPSIYPIIPFIMLYPIIYNSKYNNKSANNILATKIISYIGKISYSLYLWHYIFLVLYKYKYIIIYFLHILLYSLSSFYLIELPSKSINNYLFIYCFPILFGFYLWRISRKTNFKNKVTVPPLFHSNYMDIYNECMKNIVKSSYSSYIIAKEWYLLIGDSHLLIWSPFIYELASLKNKYLLFIWTHLNERLIAEYRKYVTHLRMINLYKINLIFVSNFCNSKYKKIKNLENLIINSLNILKEINKEVFYIEDVPYLNFNPHNYVRYNVNNSQFYIYSNKCIYKNNSLIRKSIKKKYLSFINDICINGICSVLISNVLMYVDVHHLSFQFVNLFKFKLLIKYKELFKLETKNIYFKKRLFLLHFLNSTARYC